MEGQSYTLNLHSSPRRLPMENIHITFSRWLIAATLAPWVDRQLYYHTVCGAAALLPPFLFPLQHNSARYCPGCLRYDSQSDWFNPPALLPSLLPTLSAKRDTSNTFGATLKMGRIWLQESVSLFYPHFSTLCPFFYLPTYLLWYLL